MSFIRPVALRSRTYVAAPVSTSTTAPRQTFVFRIPLDRHLESSDAYFDVPVLANAGQGVMPMYAGAEGLIEDCSAFLAGVQLSSTYRHGHLKQIRTAIIGSATNLAGRGALTGAADSPSNIVDYALDSVATNTGVPTYYGGVTVGDGDQFAKITRHFGAVRVNAGVPFPDPGVGWRDQPGSSTIFTADPLTTARGMIRLADLVPEMGVLPMGLLPRIPGSFLELRVTFRQDWCQDRDVGSTASPGLPSATCQISDQIRFVSRAFEYATEDLAMIEKGFVGYQAAYWATRLAQRPFAALPGAAGTKTTLQLPLGFQGEMVGDVILARTWDAMTVPEQRVLRELRADAFGRADTELQLLVDNKAMFRRPLRHAEKWTEAALAFGVPHLRNPPGSGESFVALAMGDANETGRLIYDLTTYVPIATRFVSSLAPLAVDLRVDRSAGKVPSNAMPTGRAGLQLVLNAVTQGSSITDGAGTLYAWAKVATQISFAQGPNGLSVRVNPVASA
jgi:hypothetical protein